MVINNDITSRMLMSKIEKMWELSQVKLESIIKSESKINGTPLFTVDGIYTTRGWTEWTHGFLYGSALLHFDATNSSKALDYGVENIVSKMANHVTHFGVHDHGFNNISTYGNLLRLIQEGRVENNLWKKNFCELALKASGAVQGRRWTQLSNDSGYIYSFNGPHSLFADTIRSLRTLAVAWQLGHDLFDENDKRISLLERLLQHAVTTARYNSTL